MCRVWIVGMLQPVISFLFCLYNNLIYTYMHFVYHGIGLRVPLNTLVYY